MVLVCNKVTEKYIKIGEKLDNQILNKICVMNRDNGKKFVCWDRLDAIAEILWDSKYRRINPQGLFHLYAKKPINKIKDRLIVISTHIDVQKKISRCFSIVQDDKMLGTYDNAITNAAVLSLMIEDCLPDNVMIAFTGDEERDSCGARQLAKYLKKLEKRPLIIVLDVTDMGWREKDYFTIENNFLSKNTGKVVAFSASKVSERWHFVPFDVDNIPNYMRDKNCIFVEAQADESWEYDEWNLECFSLCLPVSGDMHSNKGVLVLCESYENYKIALETIVMSLSKYISVTAFEKSKLD